MAAHSRSSGMWQDIGDLGQVTLLKIKAGWVALPLNQIFHFISIVTPVQNSPNVEIIER